MYRIPIIIILSLFAIVPTCLAADIPFTLEKGFIIVSAKIKKDVPVEVAISTGSPDSFISTAAVFKYKLSAGYTGDGQILGDSFDKILFFSDVPQIVLGDQKPVSLKLKHKPFTAIDKKIGREITAILGVDFLRGKILQIDFKNKLLRFLDGPPHDYKQTAGGAGPLIFKMDQPHQTTFGLSLTLPVAKEITFDGSNVRTLFDTGEAFAISMSPAAVKENGLGPVPDKGTFKIGQIKLMNMGGYEMADVPLMLLGKEAGFDKSLKEYGAIIGLGIMQNFTVTFDWKANMVTLQRS